MKWTTASFLMKKGATFFPILKNTGWNARGWSLTGPCFKSSIGAVEGSSLNSFILIEKNCPLRASIFYNY